MEKIFTKENINDLKEPKQAIASSPDALQIQKEISDQLQHLHHGEMCSLPKAPRRFTPGSHLDDPWQGKPSIPYGIIRCLAFHERRKMSHPYIRILFAEGGRKGDPWGGLHLETNGHVYHFGAGMKRFPQYHDGKGGLLPEGNQLLAEGLPGQMTFDTTDFRWVQDELDLSPIFHSDAIERIATHFEALRRGSVPIPYFQSHGWAIRLGIPFKQGYHNCTTIIAEALHTELPELPFKDFPLHLFDALTEFRKQKEVNHCSIDCEKNALLWKDEACLMDIIEKIVPAGTDLNAVAKGIVQLPKGLTWEMLVQQAGL